jgi:hypothetical protein
VSSGAIVGSTDVSDAPRLFSDDYGAPGDRIAADIHLCMVILPIAKMAGPIFVVDLPSSEHLASNNVHDRMSVSYLRLLGRYTYRHSDLCDTTSASVK